MSAIQLNKFLETLKFLSMIWMVTFCFVLVIHSFFSPPVTPIFAFSEKQTTLFQTPLYTLTPELSENNMPITSSPSDQVILNGGRDKKEIALTFDADMTPFMKMNIDSGRVTSYYDSRIPEILTKTNTKATFFLTGMWIEMYPKLTYEFAQNPLFELANHTYSHPSMNGYCYNLPQISESQYPFEIEKTQQLLKTYTNVDNHYFRFPGGCYNQKDLDLVKKEGLRVVHWDASGDDGFNSDTDQIIYTVLSRVQNGSIIVLHIGGSANTPKTAEALPIIIKTLKEKGYTFVKVSELLHPQKPEAFSFFKNQFWL